MEYRKVMSGEKRQRSLIAEFTANIVRATKSKEQGFSSNDQKLEVRSYS